MLLKIKSDGTVLYSVPESINQGSNLVNSVQVIAPFSKTLTADIAFQLPQGTITEPLFMVPREFSSDNKLNLWTIDIDRTIAQYSGTVYFTIRFYTASEDENPPILATVRSSFPVNKAVSPSLPLEPTTETYTNVLSHINDLYLTKVDRFDILDLPEGIDYTENGLKTSSALFTNATFTVSTTVYNGSLLVLANETTSDDITTRIQTEILFAEDIILRRMITIVDSVVTVGDWKNYLEEINEAVSEHNTSLTAHEDIRTAISDETIARENADIILQENIDALAESNVTSVNGETGVVTLTKSDIELGNVDNTSDLDKPVSTATQTELDGKLNKEATGPSGNTSLNIEGGGFEIHLQNSVGSYSEAMFNAPNINLYSVDSFNDISEITIEPVRVSIASQMRVPEFDPPIRARVLEIYNDNIRVRYYPEDEYYDVLDAKKGLTKAEQTLTSEEKSQIQTNIDVYSKTEVDNKVASVYKYKGSVATYEDLPIEDLSVGDVWNVIDTGDNYAWTGTVWDKLGGEVDLSNYLAKDNTTAFTPTGDYNPATKKYVDDNQLELGETSTTAYAGDKGKTAYDHSQLTSGNPHSVSKSDVGLGNVVNPNTYGNIEVSDNLDDIVYTGFYTCYGSATGAPSEDYSWFVVHLNSGVGTTYAKQIAFAYDGIQYERFKNTTWGAWKQRIQVISGFNIAVEDFQENLTYSRFPYRASVNITGITSADHCKVYFTMANINTALDTETTFQVSSYNGGIHIYATDLPTGTLTVEDIEVVRG